MCLPIRGGYDRYLRRYIYSGWKRSVQYDSKCGKAIPDGCCGTSVLSTPHPLLPPPLLLTATDKSSIRIWEVKQQKNVATFEVRRARARARGRRVCRIFSTSVAVGDAVVRTCSSGFRTLIITPGREQVQRDASLCVRLTCPHISHPTPVRTCRATLSRSRRLPSPRMASTSRRPRRTALSCGICANCVTSSERVKMQDPDTW